MTFPVPRSLFARITLILCLGLAAAQGLSSWLTMMERDRATLDIMTGYVEREVVTSVALLDHLPGAERERWLPQLARRSYRFILGPGITGVTPDAELSQRFATAITDGIGKRYALTVNAVPGDAERFQVHLALSDGMPLTIDMRPMAGAPLSGWLPALLAMQLILLGLCCWFAVRLATRPLHQLAQAADGLGPELQATRLPEDGPSEVARAARAFNAMQERIALYVAERIRILAAISHDLQTPITRMRMRVDMMDDSADQDRLRQDLRELETLVKEGIAYAKTLHGAQEEACRIDPDALIDSLVCDYIDAGQAVTLRGTIGMPLVTKPQALKRILGNLVDNALKFGGAAEVEVARADGGRVAIGVLDRGPGIPEEELAAVFEPFVRLETSRNRDTGGTGLGLSIVRQLATTLGAEIVLRNREGGGLLALVLLSDLGPA
ncbi:ATP-binding protein [Pseudoduganella albidiflava]|uniref:histidine kinase n=2 Tax=Pseudoduganella albidiflava TaxID=321983 RepID=A0AA87XQA5_9BURK|nr:ATP-binding protein [Pseudoduganella albidiflava]GGY33158.1 two-component sensor histidine kinase [Pseudoduganella albidiflava]